MELLNCDHGAVVQCGDRLSGPDLMNRVSHFDTRITRTAVLLGEKYWHRTNRVNIFYDQFFLI